MTNFYDSSSDMHPFGCKGFGGCIHCDRVETPDHIPETCQLCYLSGFSPPPIPVSKAVIVLPDDGTMSVDVDGTIKGATVLRHCRDPVHVFENVPGPCQCGEHQWGDDF
jgi:hypothetical protein